MNKEEAIKKMINDSAYHSPIEMIYHNMQMHFEDEVCKAVQQVDIHVDKEELLKALQYDREQFAKGYANAKAIAMQRQHEERENMITWLAKFCRHIDMPEHLSDEDAEILWREKMKQQFGWDQDMIQIEIERRPDAERMAYMQGYKAGIEKGHKDMLGQRAIKGRWLWDQDGNKFCSNCRTGTSRETNASVPLFEYCPYCGSDNRERGEKSESVESK